MNESPLILIVDDNNDNLSFLSTILKDYRRAIAINGEFALQTLKKIKPDLILLDVMMPGIDGFELCKQIKDNPETENIPIIFLTAKTQKSDLIYGFQLGAEDYLTKPFYPDELLARIKTHLALKNSKEKIIKQNENLQKLNREISNLMSLSIHDFKNYLEIIRGFSNLIIKSDSKEDFPQVKEFSADIKKTSEAMLEVITNLSEIVKRENGSYQLSIFNFDLIALIKDIIKNYQVSSNKKNIKINFESSCESIILESDMFLVKQIIDNLISNAIKFTYPGKEINVNLLLKYNENDEQIISLEVKDKGPGIKSEEIPLLFKKFSKLSSKPTNNEISTGLGLALVAHNAELLRSVVRCESKYGIGSSFIFEINQNGSVCLSE